MRDINIAGRDVDVDNSRNSKENPWVKIAIALLVLIGTIATALLGSQWLPQIWDKIRGV